MTRKYSSLACAIASCAFCDNGAMIGCAKIDDALEADRRAGFKNPTHEEYTQMIQGGFDGTPPPEIDMAHPALAALLTEECT